MFPEGGFNSLANLVRHGKGGSPDPPILIRVRGYSSAGFADCIELLPEMIAGRAYQTMHHDCDVIPK